MTDKQDPITHAARLLREAANELRQAHTLSSDRNNWIGEPEAKAAYDEHMAAALALEDWEAAVGAGGVQALSATPAEQSQPRYSHLHDADAVHGKRLSVYSKPTAEQQAMESVLVDGVAYQTPAPVLAELVRLNIALQVATYGVVTPEAGATTEAASGGVYAELPQPDSWFHFTPQYWENTLRDFADRTHALRLQQAAPKAAPGEQFDSEGFRAWVRKNLPDDTIIGSSAWWADHLTTWAQRFVNTAPQQEAQEPSRAAKTWCSYVAGMIGCYLNEPDESTKVQAIAGIIERRLWALPTPQPAPAPLIARSLAEWHEDDGCVAWWAWNGREWAGEPAWIGNPNCEDWPGYHTHWTPHPDQPVFSALAAQERQP